jgi:hypothetical protein
VNTETKYAAEQGIAEEAAFKKSMEAKSKEFVEKGRGGLREGVIVAAVCDRRRIAERRS